MYSRQSKRCGQLKVLEVNTLQTGMDTVEKDLDVQKQQLQQIEQSIQAFVDLRDSFKGLGGQSIRQFFVSSFVSKAIILIWIFIMRWVMVKRMLRY